MPLSTNELIMKYPLVSEQNGVVFKLAKTECEALMNWAYNAVSSSLSEYYAAVANGTDKSAHIRIMALSS